MALHVEYTELRPGDVVYDRMTGLFPFSPRPSIDRSLIERLKRSIAELGYWQPFIVRAGTLEGIAGNHRFLALVELATEQGVDLDTLALPAAVVTCDEGTAIAIALAENEFREDLSDRESLRALLSAATKKAHAVKTVFSVSDQEVQQLRLFDESLMPEAERAAGSAEMRQQLKREWILLVNRRLGDYPDLRNAFLDQLRHPTWLLARSITALDKEITEAILRQGARFEKDRTWNAMPPPKCLGCLGDYDQYRAHLKEGSVASVPLTDGSVTGACPHLRVVPYFDKQFVPDPAGSETVKVGTEIVHGQTSNLLETLESYCVDPARRQQQSCFHTLEAEAQRETYESLHAVGLPTTSERKLQEAEVEGGFHWLNPEIDGVRCAPETCLHRSANPPGYALLPQRDGSAQMVCVHRECGSAAQEATGKREEAQRRREQRQLRDTIEALQKATVEQTLLSASEIDLTSPRIFAALEALILPKWDDETMLNIMTGWWLAAQADPHIVGLPEKPTKLTVRSAYMALRERVLADGGPNRWLACLALARTWRNQMSSLEQAMEMLHKLLTPETIAG